MGERFRNVDKNFVCSFFNCKASFSKSWKLEAHLCKHTGLVSISKLFLLFKKFGMLDSIVFSCFFPVCFVGVFVKMAKPLK